MTNKLFKSFFAVVAMLGVALGFTSCEIEGDEIAADPKVEVSATSLNFANGEGEQTVNVTSNSNWKVEVANADWLTVTPTSGNGDKTLTVAVAENTTGALREATIKVIALHATYGAWDTKSIKVSQSATDAPTVTEELLYGDNFDGKEATKTYGSGSSWPYIDQFPEFDNAEGPASENVTYTGSGVSVRANSTSNSNYSDYAGSGLNNIFFGANAYFQINNIALDTTTASYKLTFGSEKYLMEGDSTFNNEELKVLLSMDGYSWTEIEYTYAGTEPARWNVATADFTLTTVPSNLYIKFVATVASAYRIDDVKLFTGNGGQEVTLTEGEAPEPAEEGTVAAAIQATDGSTIKVDEATVIAIYNRGFLMEDASGKILVYTNEKATVAIGTKVSVEGTVTTYGGFKQFAALKGADGNYGAAPTVTTISEGTFTQPTPKTMDGAAMDAYLLSPKIEYVEYTGVLSISGTYYNVTIEGAQTAIGSISYPIEGTVNAANGQTIVVRGYTIGISSSKYVNTMLVECTAEGEAPEIEVKKVTIAEFLTAEEDNTWYELTGVIGEVKNNNYGNFFMSDATDKVYVYGLYDESGNKVFTSLGLKTGDTITLRGRRSSYNDEPQVGSAVYISHVAGEGGETPVVPAEGAYASDAAFVCTADDSTNAAYSLGSTAINGSAATGFKLGKTKQAGKFTSAAVGVTGDKYLNLYAVAWKGGDAKLYFRVDGGATQSLTLVANDGATGNIPYTALTLAETDHYSVKLTGLTATSTIEFSTDANFALTTSDSAMSSARAIVCGVKLTDEPLSSEDSGSDEPEQPAEVKKVSVLEFLNAAEDDTVYELTGEITSVTNETYGNFYLKDSTGEVLIYGLCSPTGETKYWAASGTKVGDTITVQTVRTSYNGTPQGKNAIFVSLVAGSGDVTPEQPAEVKKVSVLEFLNAAEGDTIYELTGVIENVANTYYGNFDLVDATGRVYVYGIYDENGEKVFTSLGLKAGDTLTIRGVRTSYNDEPQMGNGVYVSHVAGAEVEQPENEATLSFADVANRTSYTTEQQVWEQNGITLTNNKGESTSNVGDYSAPARFYKSSNLKVETEKAMTKIVFACNNATYATALQGSITSGAVTVDGSIVTVTLADSATSYSIASLGAQVRMNSLTVTFAE